MLLKPARPTKLAFSGNGSVEECNRPTKLAFSGNGSVDEGSMKAVAASEHASRQNGQADEGIAVALYRLILVQYKLITQSLT